MSCDHLGHVVECAFYLPSSGSRWSLERFRTVDSAWFALTTLSVIGLTRRPAPRRRQEALSASTGPVCMYGLLQHRAFTFVLRPRTTLSSFSLESQSAATYNCCARHGFIFITVSGTANWRAPTAARLGGHGELPPCASPHSIASLILQGCSSYRQLLARCSRAHPGHPLIPRAAAGARPLQHSQ